LNDEFGADFVAAGADGWADGGEEIGWIRMEASVEFTDGLFEDAGEGAAPTGVDCGYGAVLGIGEKDGDAVGGLDGEEEARSFCERSIAITGFFGGRGERPDDGGMDLFEGDEWEFLSAEGSLKFLAVFEDVFAGVPFGEAEVEYALAVEVGDTAGGGAEAVEEPGKFSEGVEFEDF